MLNQPMMEKLLAMRLQGMAEALKTQEQDRAINELSFLERLALLVDQQWTWRENQALARRVKAAKLRGPACVEDIDYRAARGLDKTVMRALAKDSSWVRNHENIFVLGPTGVGKSFIALALAQKACRDGYSALYLRAAALLRELALARADGSLRHFLARLGRIDVLVIDDWAMAPLNETERREVWEICEDRYQTRSTVLTSQLPVSRWHEQIGDPLSPMASWTVWFTMPTASKCAASPCARNAIRHRTKSKNEPKPVSVRCLSYGTNFPDADCWLALPDSHLRVVR
jgi:DNA replication protein DnaC